MTNQQLNVLLFNEIFGYNTYRGISLHLLRESDENLTWAKWTDMYLRTQNNDTRIGAITSIIMPRNPGENYCYTIKIGEYSRTIVSNLNIADDIVTIGRIFSFQTTNGGQGSPTKTIIAPANKIDLHFVAPIKTWNGRTLRFENGDTVKTNSNLGGSGFCVNFNYYSSYTSPKPQGRRKYSTQEELITDDDLQKNGIIIHEKMNAHELFRKIFFAKIPLFNRIRLADLLYANGKVKPKLNRPRTKDVNLELKRKIRIS